MEDFFELAGTKFRSRLIVGTGKYKDFAETKKAIEVSGAEIVTVAVRRVNITDPNKENLLDYLDPKKYTILPNTAGCYNADDAVRTCRLAREAGVGKLVKLEVIGDDRTLFPDVPATLDAAKTLVKEGLHRPALHYRRSHHSPKTRRHGLRRGDAVGGADRLRTGHSEPVQHQNYFGARQSAGDRRRRRGHGLGCGGSYGNGLRRSFNEHRYRRRQRSNLDGRSDAPGR